SRDHKKMIATGFADRVVTKNANIDEQLAEIRQSLAGELGPIFNFYDPDLKPIWLETAYDPVKWDAFIYWSSRWHGWDQFDADEPTYKVEIAEKLATARNALAGGSLEWPNLLKQAFSGSNLTYPIDTSRFLTWCRDETEDAARVLAEL